MKEIHLIFDRKFGCIDKATTNREKAIEEVRHLNSREITERYTICTYKDFAEK